MQVVRELLVNLGLVLSGIVVGIIISLIFLEHMRGELTRLNEYADSVKAKYVEENRRLREERNGEEDG